MPETPFERCLAGQVNTAACHATIKRFWEADPAMLQTARRHGLEPALVRAIAAAESRFNPSALSPKGARGLMQVMPATGADLGVAESSQLFDAHVSADAGARYIAQMWHKFKRWDLAIAAYNAGPGAVQRAGNNIPNFPETQAYVVQVLRLYALFKAAEVRNAQLQPGERNSAIASTSARTTTADTTGFQRFGSAEAVKVAEQSSFTFSSAKN